MLAGVITVDKNGKNQPSMAKRDFAAGGYRANLKMVQKKYK